MNRIKLRLRRKQSKPNLETFGERANTNSRKNSKRQQKQPSLPEKVH
jgi:hypothetical protein